MVQSVYMNFAADLRATPVDNRTEQALHRTRVRQRAWSNDRDKSWAFFRNAIARSRQEVARALNGSPRQVVFTDGTLSGLRALLAGARRAGLLVGEDTLLASDLEYGTTYRELEGHPVEIVRLDRATGPERVERVLAACERTRPRLVILSHVALLDGSVTPVAELIRRSRQRMGAGAPLWAIDGAQAFGNIAVDVTEIGADFYFGCFHKWVQGPPSTGFLYVSNEDALRGVVRQAAHVLALDSSLEGASATECSRVGLLLPETAVLAGHLARRSASVAGFEVSGALRRALEQDELLAPHLLHLAGDDRSAIVSLRLPDRLSSDGLAAGLSTPRGPGVAIVATVHAPRVPPAFIERGVIQNAVLRFSTSDLWNRGADIAGIVARTRWAWARASTQPSCRTSKTAPPVIASRSAGVVSNRARGVPAAPHTVV